MDFFGKDASFNPAEDSTVRSHIYNLRNKLDKYYLTQGRSDKIRFVIPKGRYEVVFTDAPPDVDNPLRSQRTVLFSFAFLILLILAGLFLTNRFFVLKSSTVAARTSLPDVPWNAIKNSDKPTLFVAGDFFVYVHRKNDEYGNRRIRNGRINSYEELMDYYEKYPQEKQDFTGLTHSYLSTGVSHGTMNLMPLLIRSGLDVQFRHASNLTQEDLETYNIVFVGPLKTLRNLKPYFEKSRFEFDLYPHVLTVKEESDTTNLKVFNAEIESGLQYRKDYGFVIQVPGPADNTIMIITAFSTVVLPSLTELLQSGEINSIIQSSTSPESFPNYFKVLLQVDIISDTIVHSLVEFSEIH